MDVQININNDRVRSEIEVTAYPQGEGILMSIVEYWDGDGYYAHTVMSADEARALIAALTEALAAVEQERATDGE